MSQIENERRFLLKKGQTFPSGYPSRKITQGAFETGKDVRLVLQYLMGLPMVHLYIGENTTPSHTQHLTVLDGAALFQYTKQHRLSLLGMSSELPAGWKARFRCYDGTHYVLDIKGPRHGTTRPEYGEYELSPAKGAALLQSTSKQQSKTRHYIPYAGHEWHVDENGPDHPYKVVCEIEIADPHEAIQLPPWVGEEITHIKINAMESRSKCSPT